MKSQTGASNTRLFLLALNTKYHHVTVCSMCTQLTSPERLTNKFLTISASLVPIIMILDLAAFVSHILWSSVAGLPTTFNPCS